ncbi:protein phosphatase 2C [Reticulomyxa filosa]|uniref:Protein phosphatase 2C n=1 Tax=Reticulomyxa filosa TaxID=46433 RepID=X6NWV2_RETFI|nr:protein phosphatase 2C [Reticulomyxa filosa]|eukprot:ETO30309.1 protein phosphatase 2C [Reticulomyxa filosa]
MAQSSKKTSSSPPYSEGIQYIIYIYIYFNYFTTLFCLVFYFPKKQKLKKMQQSIDSSVEITEHSVCLHCFFDIRAYTCFVPSNFTVSSERSNESARKNYNYRHLELPLTKTKGRSSDESKIFNKTNKILQWSNGIILCVRYDFVLTISLMLEKHIGSSEGMNEALEKTTKELDESAMEECQDGSGSTGVIVIMDRQWNNLWCCNVGDSRCILIKEDGQVSQLSIEHKPIEPSERKRIEDAEGWIAFGRVMGILGVSRSFGDKEFKTHLKNLVISTPSITHHLLQGLIFETEQMRVCKVFCFLYTYSYAHIYIYIHMHMHMHMHMQEYISNVIFFFGNVLAQDQFIVCACDGLFDVFSNEEVAKFIQKEPQKLSALSLDKMSDELVTDAIKNRRSKDNVSTIVLRLAVRPPITPSEGKLQTIKVTSNDSGKSEEVKGEGENESVHRYSNVDNSEPIPVVMSSRPRVTVYTHEREANRQNIATGFIIDDVPLSPSALDFSASIPVGRSVSISVTEDNSAHGHDRDHGHNDKDYSNNGLGHVRHVYKKKKKKTVL